MLVVTVILTIPVRYTGCDLYYRLSVTPLTKIFVMTDCDCYTDCDCHIDCDCHTDCDCHYYVINMK